MTLDFSAIDEVRSDWSIYRNPDKFLKLCREVLEIGESKPTELRSHIAYDIWLLDRLYDLDRWWAKKKETFERVVPCCPCSNCEMLTASLMRRLLLEAKIRQRLATIERQNDARSWPRYIDEPAPGYVYVLQHKEDHYKIGKSRRPELRVNELTSILLPRSSRLINLIRTNNRHKAELFLHEKYAEARDNGEWFSLLVEEVEELVSIETLEF